jgi:phage tail-like protein
MRGVVEGLGTPYPLSTFLPAFMQEDPFLVRMTAGLDDVVAPIISVLDCIDAYVDPMLAPPDFVEWLAAWLGSPLDDHWEDARRRASVLAASELHRMRGTVGALRAVVELATGGSVEVFEQGGTSWSSSPTDDVSGDDAGSLLIRVAVDAPDSVRLRALDEVVSASKPAHLPHTIEVVQR